MDLVAAWLLYPAALLAICLGLGLLVGRLAAWRMPRLLLVGVGLATLIALARLLTATSATAPLALPAVLILAVAGFALGRSALAGRVDPLFVLGGAGVFAVFAAPVVLSGDPTFAGYTSLPDTSHQLALAELLAERGPDFASLPESSYRLALAKYVDTAYPVASQAALGITAPLGLLDVAWLYQPWLAFIAATTFAGVAVLARPYIPSRWLLVLVAFVAAQPALLVSFALQGSIKELTTVTMLVLAVTVLVAAARERRPARSLLPLAVVGAAAFGALGPAAGPYLVVIAAAAVVLWAVRSRERGRRGEALWLAAGGAVAAVLSIPMLVSLRTAVVVNSGTLDNAGDLGNLAAPLRRLQAFGIWLNGDFRYLSADHRIVTYTAAAVAVAAVVGVAWLISRRAFGALLLLGALLLPSVVLLRQGSPYADAKVLMLMSPALLLMALFGTASPASLRRRAPALALTALLGAGVLVSNAMAYHDVSLAPQDRYAELLDVNELLDGRGPAISTEYDEFGEYFLRDAAVRSQPEYPHEYRGEPYRPNALADPGRRPSIKTPLDPDDLELGYVQSAPWMVVRRSPITSRPPANFRLARRGRWYDVWQRTPRTRVLAHVPLGLDITSAGDVAPCAEIGRLAGRARAAGGRLAYAERNHLPTVVPTELLPVGRWYPYGAYPGSVVPDGPGRMTTSFAVARGGAHRLWIEGSFGREVRVEVDGAEVGGVRNRLNNPGNWESVGPVRLREGRHRLDLVQGGGTLSPGTGGIWASLRHVGPLKVSHIDDEAGTVRTITADKFRDLCGRTLDWIEIVA